MILAPPLRRLTPLERLVGEAAVQLAELGEVARREVDAAERHLRGRLGFYRPGGGFFLWLDVGDGEGATRRLWSDAALRVMPGAYLSYGEGNENPGAPYIRVALVDDLATTTDALMRIRETLTESH